MKLSVALIVKNEESCLDRCLNSVKDFDEIVVVDTGSIDKTKEIAKKYTDKIYDFEWCDDFSKARNFVADKCSGDWILSIDADHELLSTVEEVREWAIKANKEVDVAKVKAIWNKDSWFYRATLSKKGVKWTGEIHECLPATDFLTEIKEQLYYSDSHRLDPDRNLRILLKAKPTQRTKFYLGREYFERKEWQKAIDYMTDYLKKANWIPEIGEAYLVIAQCYKALNNWNMARHYCLYAINVNPNFKEALILMSSLSYEENAKKWKEFANLADNSNVLFIRL